MNFRRYKETDEIYVKDIFRLYWTDPEFLDELASNLLSDDYIFYVLEKDNEINGIVGLRKASGHLLAYTDTEKPVELYIIATKHQRKGVGSLLGQRTIKELQRLKWTEIICYSPETHSSSWKFYENLGFSRVGIINDPDDGYPGMLWKKKI